MQVLAQAQRLPKVTNKLEVALFLMPAPVQEQGERPYFPYNLLFVESESRMVVSTEVLAPLPSLEAMWARVPLTVVQKLLEIGVMPQEIDVSSPQLQHLLGTLQPDLGFQVKRKRRLPALDQARRAMERFMRQM
ncbi:MAG: hypothetical protein R3C14_04890 [Caldilineaceae bacterium]